MIISIPVETEREADLFGQDYQDGAALRRLVEARDGKPVAILFHDDLWYCEAGVLPTPSGATIAEAADKCREALGE